MRTLSEPPVLTIHHGRYNTRIDAHVDRKNVGYAVIHPRGSESHLDGLRVNSRWQRLGIGTLLMQQVVQHFGESLIRLRPLPFGNEAMSTEQLIEFYAKFGFVRDGIYVFRRACRFTKTQGLDMVSR